MKDVQEIFDQIQVLKQEQKEIKAEYRDALENANNYTETKEKIKDLRDKKKEIEIIVQGDLGSRWNQHEENKKKLSELQEMLTDIAMSTLMEGKSIAIRDKQEHEYEPVYKVSFRKIG